MLFRKTIFLAGIFLIIFAALIHPNNASADNLIDYSILIYPIMMSFMWLLMLFMNPFGPM